jgi:glycosyltransferase involved in cell wall biosynthesis
MRIVIDLQGAQCGSRNRGIGRYSLNLVLGMCRNRGAHEILIALSDLFPDTIESLREVFHGILPPTAIRVWSSPPSVAWSDPENSHRRKSAELIREAFVASLDPDVVLLTSLIEGWSDDSVTSIKQIAHVPTAVVLYDLIPLLNQDDYLTGGSRAWYFEKLDYLRRADLLLSISNSAALEAIGGLNWDFQRVVNISAAAGTQFRPLMSPPEEQARIAQTFNLSRKYLMYSGGIEPRKNVEGLIRAYALLPQHLRNEHQLAIVCGITDKNRRRLTSLARSVGLSESEVVFTGFVSDDDLVRLYNSCRAFACPSFHEGFGLPALEAMQCGKAVIASNTSSLPEVVGNEEALFDPRNDTDIAISINRVLSDDGFRQQLERHGLTQAQNFSWDRTAKAALEALSGLHTISADRVTTPLVVKKRPRLAIVSARLPDQPGIASNAELLSALDAHYQIDLVVTQGDVSSSQIKAHIKVRDVEWLRFNAEKLERIVYELGNPQSLEQIASLLEDIPGAVLIQDFYPSNIQTPTGSQHWVQSVLDTHCSQDLLDSARLNGLPGKLHTLSTYSPILQNSAGVMLHSDRCRRLAERWYGADAVSNWTVIDDPWHDPQGCAQLFRDTLEGFYTPVRCAARELPRQLVLLGSQTTDDDRFLAWSLASSFPPRPRRRTLFIDVSALEASHARTKIGQVMRSIVKGLVCKAGAGLAVLPVRESELGRYVLANSFVANVESPGDSIWREEGTDAASGDIFLRFGPDERIGDREIAELRRLRRRGVSIQHVVYSLLPLRMSQNSSERAAHFADWLTNVASFDGAICISRAVADDLKKWVANQGSKRKIPFSVNWFHLGSEGSNSAHWILPDLGYAVEDWPSEARQGQQMQSEGGPWLTPEECAGELVKILTNEIS